METSVIAQLSVKAATLLAMRINIIHMQKLLRTNSTVVMKGKAMYQFVIKNYYYFFKILCLPGYFNRSIHVVFNSSSWHFYNGFILPVWKLV